MFSLLISCKFICSLLSEEMFRSELQGVSIFFVFSMAAVSHTNPSSVWSSTFVFHMQFSLPFFYILASKCGPKPSEDSSHVFKRCIDIRQSACLQMEAIYFRHCLPGLGKNAKFFYIFSSSARSRSLFVSKVRFLPFCATYCIARWSKCDHALCGNFRNTFR